MTFVDFILSGFIVAPTTDVYVSSMLMLLMITMMYEILLALCSMMSVPSFIGSITGWKDIRMMCALSLSLLSLPVSHAYTCAVVLAYGYDSSYEAVVSLLNLITEN